MFRDNHQHMFFIQTRDSIFLTAFSMAGMFFLKVDHCSSVKLIPEEIIITYERLEMNKKTCLTIVDF